MFRVLLRVNELFSVFKQASLILISARGLRPNGANLSPAQRYQVLNQVSYHVHKNQERMEASLKHSASHCDPILTICKIPGYHSHRSCHRRCRKFASATTTACANMEREQRSYSICAQEAPADEPLPHCAPDTSPAETESCKLHAHHHALISFRSLWPLKCAHQSYMCQPNRRSL